MAITFLNIETDFRQLRAFVLNDLDRITGQEIGGNYAAAAIVACAYDAIASLRDGASSAGERPFRDTLPRDWQPVARSLYNALRNGLVHGYETQTIRIPGHDVELGIAWRGGRHLTLDDDHLIVAVPDLAQGLRTAFDAFEARLRSEPTLRDEFRQRYRRGRVYEVRSVVEQDAWRRLLGT